MADVPGYHDRQHIKETIKDAYNADPDSRKVEKPEQMPLIEVIDPMGRNIAHTQSCCCRVCSRLRKQRDADMAWHNEKAQQVRKALLKKLADKIENEVRQYVNGVGDASWNDAVTYCSECIRAMAEEEDNG